MLRLRKILLCDYFYYLIFIISLLLTLIIVNQNQISHYNETDTEVVGKIISIKKDENKITYLVKGKEKILINYKGNNNYHLGDKVIIKGIFKIPNTNTTKYLFNYKEYLKSKKIYFIVESTSIIKISNNKNIYYKVKEIIINYINNPYLKTFILGDKSSISKEIIRSYQANGISHLFAISGMHIALLASILEKIIKKFFNEESRIKIISIFLLLYLLLVGLSPSILRGILFYILFKGNNIYYFYIKKDNLFLLILSISLLINPYFIYDIGFKYSYLISYSLLKMSKYLSSNNKIISLLKVSILSFTVSIPITIKNYYQINLLSIIYNILYVPFISIIIYPLSLIVLLIKPLEPFYNLIILLLEKSSLILSNITITEIVFKRLPDYVYIIYFLLIIFYLNIKNKKILLLFFLLLIIHLIIPFFDNTYIEVIDVGQGDSTLIHLNNKNILLDTGGNNSDLFYNTISPVLKTKGIKKLDYLILTHGDYDHMGEAINLVNNFKVEKVIFNCGPYNDLEQELIKVLDKKKIKYYSCIKELKINKNKLYFLQTKKYDNENDNSNVIYTELNGYKFMFMGDASIITEKEIISKYNLPAIDVLKVGHHGSKTSSSEEFIKEVRPTYSLISVGNNNKFGHPNEEVLNNLEESKIYRTDEYGSIMFKIKNNKLEIEACSP